MGLLELLKGQANTPAQNQLRELDEQQKAPGSMPSASAPKKDDPASLEESRQKEMRFQRALAAFEARQAAKKATTTLGTPGSNPPFNTKP